MRVFLAVVLITLSSVVLATDGDKQANTETVQHDPFKKPALFHAPTNPTIANKIPSSSEPHFKITAILQAGKDSMVIIEGKTLRMGEIFEGYTLTEISERSAVFSKDKKSLLLTIDKTNEITPP